MEKTFDLKFVKVSELDKTDTKLLKKYLSTLEDKYVLEFLLKVLDNEYSLAPEYNSDKLMLFSLKKVEEFIADKQFNKFRYDIMQKIDDEI